MSDNAKLLIIGLATLLLVFTIGLTAIGSLILPRTSVVPLNPKTPILLTTETVAITRTLSVNLTGGHTYLWSIRVSQGRLKATLANETATFWAVTRDSDGSIAFNTAVDPTRGWVAPRTALYSLILENQDPNIIASCRIEVWDMNLSVKTT
jgi:hypothetical protein